MDRRFSNLARWQGQLGYVPVEWRGTFTPEGFVPNEERKGRRLRGQKEVNGWRIH
ncbi:MAG: hypothetical protein IKI28_06450 [Bacteroidales bacterium]|nr:hypothetical protein [Bacteroidales bacterium]